VKEGENSLPVAFFVLCRSPPARKGRGEEAALDPHAAWIFLRRRVEQCAATVPADPKCIPELFLNFFGLHFVNFKLFNVIFI
jgi:hypothetical protein